MLFKLKQFKRVSLTVKPNRYIIGKTWIKSSEN